MPKTSPKPTAPKRKPGRPKGTTPPPNVTGVRIPQDILARVDALAEKLSTGAVRASRSSIVVAALVEYLDAHEAAS